MTKRQPTESIGPSVEALAFSAWRVSLGTEPPTERIDTNGGPLDPEAWCMKAARAILDGTPMPPLAKNLEGEHLREPILNDANGDPAYG